MRNADVIDQGVVKGDIAYIWSTGLTMLGITLVQVICAIIAVYFGSRLAMGVGRDLRSSFFHRVVAFSQREVGQFGAPSLITRNTNDVQQAQMLVHSLPTRGCSFLTKQLRQSTPAPNCSSNAL